MWILMLLMLLSLQVSTHNYCAPIIYYCTLIYCFSHTAECDELELLTNGMIVYSPNTTAPYIEGTNAEHICNPGFVLIGNVIRVCQNDTTFSGVPPMCTRK